MDLQDLLDWAIITYGVYLLIGLALRPPFFWDTKRMLQRRKLIGDRNTMLMYGVIALLLLGLGAGGLTGFL